MIGSGRPRAIRKLIEFAELPAGWHYGQGGPIDRELLGNAEDVIHLFFQLGLTLSDAFPGAAGEVMVVAYHRSHRIAVTLDPQVGISFLHEDGDQECCERENLSVAVLKEELRRVASEIWPISGYSIQNSSNTTVTVSGTLPSKNPAMAVYLASKSNVRPLVAA